MSPRAGHGLESEEIAVAPDVWASTVRREWRMARAWLRLHLADGAAAAARG